uniref:Perilipin n=1 Tax=Crocodylus porosus TaxID=8502 RepID=A0A7M4FW19_CROPO
MASENKATDPSPSQNVVNRVTSIPLIHSAFNLVSSAYNFTKGTHPYVTTVCTVAETVAAVAVGSAVGGAQPILSHLEPQIAKVNEYACKSLDQLEEKLPFLQQPTEKQLVANTVMNAVDTAKDAMASRVAGAVDLTKHVVQDSVELTKSVVSSTVNTALDAASEAIQDGVEMTNAMLWKSEELVDHYLPVTEEELGEKAVASVEQQKLQQSYFVRLGSLSNKVRHRAYLHSLNKLQLVKKNTQDTLAYLHSLLILLFLVSPPQVESVKEGAGQKLQEGQEKLYELWLEWILTQATLNSFLSHQVEPRVLAMLRMTTLQLQPAYTNLMSSIQGLPSSIQETMQQALTNVQQLQASFSSACSFQDLSASILSQNQDRVVKLRESLDALLDYVAKGVPLNWLVGPFSPLFQLPPGSRGNERPFPGPPQLRLGPRANAEEGASGKGPWTWKAPRRGLLRISLFALASSGAVPYRRAPGTESTRRFAPCVQGA